MTDLEQRLRSLADQPVPEPTGVEQLARRARNLRRKRRSLRAGGALLGVVLLAGAVLSVAGVIAPPPSVVFGPGGDRPAVELPEGWQTITVGAAAFSVPGDWPVTEVGMPGPIPHPEHIFRSGPGVYVGDRLYQPPGPPAREDAPPRSPGVYALPAHGDPEHARWLADEGTPVMISQQEGLWAATEEFRWYAFPGLDLLLWVSYDPEPALMDQVLATVRHADSAPAMDEPPQDDQEGVLRVDTPDSGAAMEMRPDLMEVEPEEASPGEVVRLHFPQETGRGVAFVLEQQTPDSWALRYYLVAGTENEGAAEWWTPDDAEGRGWEDLGVGGPGPDFIEIPETAERGSYRVCTANAGDEFCAPIRVGT